MATLQSVSVIPHACGGGSRRRRSGLTALPSTNSSTRGFHLPRISSRVDQELILQQGSPSSTKQVRSNFNTWNKDKELLAKFLEIAEAAADRAEMHAIIGAQRDNWNHLLTHSMNLITLTASLMAGIASLAPAVLGAVVALKVSSAILFGAATGVMMIVDKIQPSQLAEEQRKAFQLFKQLESFMRDTLMLRAPTESDVEEAMEKVLVLDKAYPLPLLPVMLEKFPKNVEPTRWWPKLHKRHRQAHQDGIYGKESNGWSKELETEMLGLHRVLMLKDEEQYVAAGRIALAINKTLATLGPLLTGLAAVGSILIGFQPLGAVPVFIAVVGGTLATVVNTLQHAGQLGMLFELFRNSAGFYEQLREEIQFNLGEEEVEERENGELFKMKVALQLGRSISELEEFAAYASSTSCSHRRLNYILKKTAKRIPLSSESPPHLTS